MDGGGNSNVGLGRGGDRQNQGGRARGKGQKPNRGGGKGGNSQNQPNQGSGKGRYAHHQPPTQGQWIDPRGNRPPPTSDPHQIGGRAGAGGPSPPSTPPVQPPLPPLPSPVLLSKVAGSRGNNLQRGSCRGGRGGGGRRYHHNQPNKGSGRSHDLQQQRSSCRLNQPPVEPDQPTSKQGQLDVVPATGTGAGGGASAPPPQPGDHLDQVSGIWSRTWKTPLLPLELRTDLLVSSRWSLSWR